MSRSITHKIMQKEEGKFLWTAKTPFKAKKLVDSYLEKKGIQIPKKPQSHKKSKSKRKKTQVMTKLPLPGETGF